MRTPVICICTLAGLFGVGIDEATGQTPDLTGGMFQSRYRKPALELTYKLSKRVDFDGFGDREVSFRDALDVLSNRYGLSFDINERAFRADTGWTLEAILKIRVRPISVPPMKNVPLAKVVRVAIAQIPVSPRATFVINRDCVEITTPHEALENGCDSLRWLTWEYADRVAPARWTDLHVYGLEAVRLLAEAQYWTRVLKENAKAITADAKVLPGTDLDRASGERRRKRD
jgi:hypothetical protein